MSRKKRAVTLPKEADGWEYEGGLLFRNFESEPCAKILGFDMDSTLIKTKSGKTFAVSKDDWVLLYDNIPEKIQQYHSDGFRIVIFTN